MFQRILLLLLILTACNTMLQTGDEASPVVPVASSSVYVPVQSPAADATATLNRRVTIVSLTSAATLAIATTRSVHLTGEAGTRMAMTAAPLSTAENLIARATYATVPPVETIDPDLLNAAINLIISSSETIASRNTLTATPIASENDRFFTRFNCSHPQTRQVTFNQSDTGSIDLFLDGLVTRIENIDSLEFSIAPDSTLYLIEEDGNTLLPVREEPIGFCGEDGTPDAPLSAQSELMVFPLITRIECPLTMDMQSTIGMVIMNTAGLDSGAFRVRVENSRYNVQQNELFVDVDNLPARSSKIYQFGSAMQSNFSQTRISMEIDSDNSVNELREDNNLAWHTVGCIPLT